MHLYVFYVGNVRKNVILFSINTSLVKGLGDLFSICKILLRQIWGFLVEKWLKRIANTT